LLTERERDRGGEIGKSTDKGGRVTCRGERRGSSSSKKLWWRCPPPSEALVAGLGNPRRVRRGWEWERRRYGICI
jgi:hypothetical protein